MEEIIDILDETSSEITGKTISKNEAHKTGIWHGAIHVIIVNNACNKTLLQKRCAKKQLYPNTWDIAVGGHIRAGESDYTSARRELEEELGLNSSDYEIKFIEKVKESLNHNCIISNEYVSIFVIVADIDVNKIHLQTDEVSTVRWFTKKELSDLINKNNIIPHIREFEILNDILN